MAIERLERITNSEANKVMKSFQYFVELNSSPHANAIRKIASIPIYSLLRQQKNIASHNLCLNSTTLPPLKQLLGLSLNFCPATTTVTDFLKIGIDKFTRDFHTKVFFTDQPVAFKRNEQDEDEKLLYLPSIDWDPPEPINPELATR